MTDSLDGIEEDYKDVVGNLQENGFKSILKEHSYFHTPVVVPLNLLQAKLLPCQPQLVSAHSQNLISQQLDSSHNGWTSSLVLVQLLKRF